MNVKDQDDKFLERHEENSESQGMASKKKDKEVQATDDSGEKGRKITGSDWKKFFRLMGTQVHPVGVQAPHSRACGKYNATSTWGRRWQTLKILSVSIISVIGLLTFVVIDVYDAQNQIHLEKKVKRGMDTSIRAASLIHRLQIERGITVLCISSVDSGEVMKNLITARQLTDEEIHDMYTWPQRNRRFKNHRQNVIDDLNGHRAIVGLTGCRLNTTINDELKFYTSLIDRMLNLLFTSIVNNKSNKMLFQLIGYRMFLIAKEKIGLERALGGSFFSKGFFKNTAELLSYAEQHVIGGLLLNSSMDYMPDLRLFYISALKTKAARVLDNLNLKREIILKNEPSPGNVTEGTQWFGLMTDYIDVLLQVQTEAGKNLISALVKSIGSSENVLVFRITILAIVVMLTPLLFMAVTRMTNTIQQYAATLAQMTSDLKEEQQRTDDLLSAMFPRSVAEMLKNGEKVPSEHFDSVTVFFSDIVNFTSICAAISPLEVTRMLNRVYSVFDDHIDKYDVYKVETIGDAYMVVSGLPIRNGVQHADEIGRMALDVVELTDNLRLEEIPTGEKLLIRVGIHTGPCVSGVVGNKMPRYCLFGDTVNTASRMQTTGTPQKIHISQETRNILLRFDRYQMEFRGTVEVKGKGHMNTFWLLGTTTRSVPPLNTDVDIIAIGSLRTHDDNVQDDGIKQ